MLCVRNKDQSQHTAFNYVICIQKDSHKTVLLQRFYYIPL